jgi:hypothetical protein
MSIELVTGQVVQLDSPSGHKHPHLEILSGAQVVGYLPMGGVIGEDGKLYQAASSSLQQKLLDELILSNAPNGYTKNSTGEVTNVHRLVNGVIQSYSLTKTTNGTDTIYTPGVWA